MTKVEFHFEWETHRHILTKRTYKSWHHHSDDEIADVCILCDIAAEKSNIPTVRHFEHPEGCKCYWCVFCVCEKTKERERC